MRWASSLRAGLGDPGIGDETEGVATGDIIRKCLASDPEGRYPDAAALAEDLRRQLNDLPLRGVRNRSRRELWRKWRRRNPGSLAWGLAGLSALLAATVAASALGLGYAQRLDQARVALRDGRSAREAGRHEEAIRALTRGIDGASSLPGASALRGALDRERSEAERGRMAAELHRLADLIRFRYGIDPPPPDEARALGQLCRSILDRRDSLERPGLAAIDEQIRTDLREVAAIHSELRRPQAEPEGRGREAPSAGPRTAWDYYDRGRSHLRRKEYALAADQFRLGLAARPQDFWLNFYQGLCAYRLGHFQESSEAFRVCNALQPDAAECPYKSRVGAGGPGRGR